MQATVQAISASATQTALEGKVKIDEAQQRANAAGLREGLFIALGILIVVGLGVGFLWYGRRMAVAVTHAATLRAATVRIGPRRHGSVVRAAARPTASWTSSIRGRWSGRT